MVKKSRFDREVLLGPPIKPLGEDKVVSFLKEVSQHLLEEDREHYIDRFELDPSGCYPEPLADMYFYFCSCGSYFIADLSDSPITSWDLFNILASTKAPLRIERSLSLYSTSGDILKDLRGYPSRFKRVLGVTSST
jgi:hypothetical protein